MKYPVTVYGDTLLRKKAKEIKEDDPKLKEIIENMWETMYQSDGVGLAAPQVNRSIRVIVIDASAFDEKYPETKHFKKAFINARIYKEEGEESGSSAYIPKDENKDKQLVEAIEILSNLNKRIINNKRIN